MFLISRGLLHRQNIPENDHCDSILFQQGCCVSEGGTWESFLREPTSRKMRMLSWIREQYSKRRKEREYTLKEAGRIVSI